jgi:hypothetical protein
MCAPIIQRREERQSGNVTRHGEQARHGGRARDPRREKSARTDSLVGCEERSFVAMLLGTDSLVGCEERSFDSLHSLPEMLGAGRIRILIGCVVNNKTPTPLCFS